MWLLGIYSGPLEEQPTLYLWAISPALGESFDKAVYALNQCPTYGTISLKAKIPWCRIQGVEIGMAPFIIIPSGSPGSLAAYYCDLVFYGLRSFGSRRGIVSTRRCNKHSTLQKVRTSSWCSGLLMPLSQSAKKEGMLLRYVIDPDYQGEIWLLSQNGDRED